MAEAALSAAQWAVGRALAPVADTVLEAWGATRDFTPNIEALRDELELVKATLKTAARKEIDGQEMEGLLQRLRDLAHNADDLLDELDYFRIHDELLNKHEAAADERGIQDLARDARHTVKALGKQLASCFGANNGDEDRGNAQETPKHDFNRAVFSGRMNDIVRRLKIMRNEVIKILQVCGPRTVLDIAQSRPITKGRIDEPKLYGRDHVMNSIIHDITEGQYCDKGLTVLPVIGPGGMGKTTLIQHIYQNQQVQNHFPVRIWICVSFNFNLDKVLEEIKRYTPPAEGEKVGSTTEDLIEGRLKSKRFLLVLDDIWQFSNEDDWEKLLSTLNQSQEKGCMILVTTRFQAIAHKVKTTEHSIELNGLETEEFRKLFLAFVFDDGQCPRGKHHLLHTGDEIMEKLKGSPLAAKTVGRLLSRDHSLVHWKKVLHNKEWETNNNGIMPALKLSYDFLPFHQQQCFSSSALFPEDYRFRSRELTSLWIGLDILIPSGQNQTFEEIGLSNLKALVNHGFFREEEIDGDTDMWYVMHDLLHDLALMVASHDFLSLRLPIVGSVEIQPTIRHLSISIENLGEYNAVSAQQLKSGLEKLKAKLKVEYLQTLMLFGKVDEGFAKIFGDFFGEANALRVLYLPDMMYPVESMLHNFSGLVHLRWLCLGTDESQMHLPRNISQFYHLRILDLEFWDGSRDLPRDMSNLAKLCHFYTPFGEELHSDIYNVGKLKLLEELKVFRVNKQCEGFEPKQLEHLTKLWELGIYNLEKIHTEEEAAQAKLMEKNYLKKLTLDWDSNRSSFEPGEEAVVLESLQPYEDLQELCIRGHRGPSYPTWLGDDLAVEALKSLCLEGVSWEVFPSLGKACDLLELRLVSIAIPKEFIIETSFYMLIKLELIGLESFEKWIYPAEQESSLGGDLLPPDAPLFPLLQVLVIRHCPKLLGLPFSDHIVSLDWFPKLQELEISYCPEFSLVIPISWIESLDHFRMESVKGLKKFSKLYGTTLGITGEYLPRLDQVLVFDKETCLEKLSLTSCPPLKLKNLLMLTSLKTLCVNSSYCLVGQLGGQGDEEWQLPIEHIRIDELYGNSGNELTELLPHLPKLSKLEIMFCENIKQLVVGVDLQQTTSAEASVMEEDEITAAEEEEDDAVLLFPAHLCDSLRELLISHCSELVLLNPLTLVPGEGWLQALRSLQSLKIEYSPKFLSAFSFSRHIFPSSLQFLKLRHVGGMGTLEPLSNLSSLVSLELCHCGQDLKCKGLRSLLTTGGQLSKLKVVGSPRFFAGWDPNPRQALEDVEGEEEQQQTHLVSSTLRELCTDDAVGLISAPICSFLSSSLTKLELEGYGSVGIERFSKEQEDAIQLLSSLQQLEFSSFHKLQQLPAGLHNLTSLKILSIDFCHVSSLPSDGLPESLQELNVRACANLDLEQQCRGLVRTIPKITINYPRMPGSPPVRLFPFNVQKYCNLA